MSETSNILRFPLENEGPKILGAQVVTCSSHWPAQGWRAESWSFRF